MTLLNEIFKEDIWNEFLNIKINKNQLRKKEIEELKIFILEKKYLKYQNNFNFNIPHRKIISKANSNKKRIVYIFDKDDLWILKLLSYLLYKYDYKIADNCYSFRKNKTVKDAWDNILKINDLNNKYVLKIDIRDYFNSINSFILKDILENIIDDDRELLNILKELILKHKCIYQDGIINEDLGAMAGMPLASFFANIYLLDLDEYFIKEKISYFRYSDDIILFLDNEEEVNKYFNIVKNILNKKSLILNMDKYHLSKPNEAFEFLGFKYLNDKIDLSDITIKKMKAKIKRKAHLLYFKKKRNNLSYEKVCRSMIKSFDYKFYDLSGNNEFTWTRFYFPIINIDKGLKIIDEYMLLYLRYLNDGRFYKGNYKIKYKYLKKLGYTPLLAEYYHWHKENKILNKQK